MQMDHTAHSVPPGDLLGEAMQQCWQGCNVHDLSGIDVSLPVPLQEAAKMPLPVKSHGSTGLKTQKQDKQFTKCLALQGHPEVQTRTVSASWLPPLAPE